MLIDGALEPIVDFNNLDSLVLESCTGLDDAFSMLMGPRVPRRDIMGASRLHTFGLRHENVNDTFMRHFNTFLVSLSPLEHLHVLLEGSSELQDLPQILKAHGKSLSSLVWWDHRTSPRADMLIETARIPLEHENLKLVAKYCTRLQALEIPPDWEDLTESSENQQGQAIGNYYALVI